MVGGVIGCRVCGVGFESLVVFVCGFCRDGGEEAGYVSGYQCCGDVEAASRLRVIGGNLAECLYCPPCLELSSRLQYATLGGSHCHWYELVPGRFRSQRWHCRVDVALIELLCEGNWK